MECRLIQRVDFPGHNILIGEIAEMDCAEDSLSDGVVDFSKVQPILLVMNGKSYWKLGERLARAWHIGKGLMKSWRYDRMNMKAEYARQ